MITSYTSQQPVNDFGLGFPGLKYNAVIAATTDTLLTVPGIAHRYKVLIKGGLNAVLWVALNEVADVPAGGGAFAADTSELVPINGQMCREVVAGDVLHFYSTAGGDVSVVFYAVNSPN
tara:strand:- start:101 stop:457 length:357 start_codon:yes stop_codon:yes gene_type:complete